MNNYFVWPSLYNSDDDDENVDYDKSDKKDNSDDPIDSDDVDKNNGNDNYDNGEWWWKCLKSW